jgi:retron-type reverse transcriptase
MGNSSIDLSLANIWRSWFKFKRGKRKTPELETFTYFLEENLRQLHSDLINGRYKHGGYKKFTVTDNKRREISVASVRDRVVHRLLYEYLAAIYDKTFIYDAWSCRKGKGLLGAIERTQKFLNRYNHSFIWRADVKKFFDNVDHETLLCFTSFRITDKTDINLLQKVIGSYSVHGTIRERE